MIVKEPIVNVHPDDFLFFTEVVTAMRRVAKKYDLALRNVTGLPMPKTSMANRMGDCSASGDIRLVMRCTEDGNWCEHPLSPSEVWNTAAHELAHLRHFDHSAQHAEFTLELVEALKNDGRDHKEKVIERLIKMQKHRESAAAIGSTAEAEAFAAMINKMLIENELNPTDLDYARATDKDPIVEIRVNRAQYKIKEVKVRVAWQETLARVVAKAHLCSFLVSPGRNSITFVGTKSHATVAEYAYGVLVPAADYMSEKEAYYFKLKCNRERRGKEWVGYRAAWLDGFCNRIAERFDEVRKQAVTESVQFTGNETQALVRLNGALRKVDEYISNKFKGHASQLWGSRSTNAAGAAAGRAAADRMPIGRRGMTTTSPRGLIS